MSPLGMVETPRLPGWPCPTLETEGPVTSLWPNPFGRMICERRRPEATDKQLGRGITPTDADNFSSYRCAGAFAAWLIRRCAE